MYARLRSIGVKRLRTLVRAMAVLYPVSLTAVILLFRGVGEAWWVTTATLYLPRILFAVPLPILGVALAVFRMRRLLLLQIVSAGLIVFPLMGFVPPLPTSVRGGAPTLRVLTFNVNTTFGGVDGVVREIEAYSPDVVLLQEIGSEEELSRRLREHYPYIELSSQFIIATRYPMLSVVEPEKLPYQGKQRSPRYLKAVLDTPLGRIVVYNVHPLSPREGLYFLRTHGVRSALRGTSAQTLETEVGLRALQVRTFAAAASAETDPVVIGGDTNLPNLSAVLGNELSSFQDGFAGAGGGFGYTFPTNKWWPWMRIDRIFASRQLRFTSFQVGRSLASDHHCVVADLQRRASP
jgi:endonuclease/exonuclease/phosphatase (EEP) superfamily protein YafD